MSGGTGNDAFQFDSSVGSDTVTDFLSGTDRLRFSQASLAVGDGDLLVEGAASIGGPGGFASSPELVIASADIVGAITADTAAAAIGSATSAFAVGQRVLFAVDNGADTSIYRFTAAAADAQVSAGELLLLGQLTGAAATAVSDFVFVA